MGTIKTLSDGDTFEHHGFRFMFALHNDADSGPPWKNSNGHGPVREVPYNRLNAHSSKRPGERILNRNPGRHDTIYAYDWQEAMKIAKRDGWRAEPYDAPNRVQRAVQADFDFFAGWVNEDWWYVGVEVTMLDEDDEPTKYNRSLWGIESNSPEYHAEVARELAEKCIYERNEEVHDVGSDVSDEDLLFEASGYACQMLHMKWRWLYYVFVPSDHPAVKARVMLDECCVRVTYHEPLSDEVYKIGGDCEPDIDRDVVKTVVEKLAAQLRAWQEKGELK